MSLQLIVGCSGSGKTYTIFEALINKKGSTHAPQILIVPEQFTLKTQGDLIRIHPSRGLMSIEVLSFQRLFYRLYDELGIAGKALLGETGKSMVIRKLIEDNKEAYHILGKNAGKKGYIEELKNFILEAYQYDIQEETFQKMQEQAKSAELSDKIKDLQKLFLSYREFVNQGYFTSESTMDLLIQAIQKNSWLEQADLFIDGFYGLTPIQYKIVRELLKKSKSLTIGITMESRLFEDQSVDESNLYYESQKLICELTNIARQEKVQINKPIILDEETPYRYQKSMVLTHLMKGLYRFPIQPFEGASQDIKICQASNIRKECQYVADSIMKLCMDKGFQYKEIAVVTGDLMGYEDLLKQVFNQYDIPFFIDQKKSIISHPLVSYILSALEMIQVNFSYFSVFRFIKAGLLNSDVIEDETIDLLENYVIAYGIRGRKMWLMEWTKPYPYTINNVDSLDKTLKKINQLRNEMITPLNELAVNLSTKEIQVAEMTRKVYDFIQQQGLENKMEDYMNFFEQQGNLTYQRAYSQIYKRVMEVFEQVVDILGEQKINLSEYIDILKSGFEACQMGLVPPGIDQVVIGDLERSRLGESRALFVLGFNEGKIPKSTANSQLVTDEERALLIQKGFKLAPDQKSNVFRSQFSIYMGLSRVKESLYISYAKSSLDGKSMRPAILLGQIKKLFPKIKIINLDEIYSNKLVVNRPKPTFNQWSQGMMKQNHSEQHKDYQEVFHWFSNENPLWLGKIQDMQKAWKHTSQIASLSAGTITDLYGIKMKNSVSRLEAYAKCPFIHFVDYGLRLRERLDYSIRMPDIGLLFHQAMDLSARMIQTRGLDWDKITIEESELLVDAAISQIVAEDQRGIFSANARNSYLVKRLTRISKRAVRAMIYQVSKGNFKPIAFEKSFDGQSNSLETLNLSFDGERSMVLSGRIDRLDAYESEDTIYMTIVDYKTGKQTIDLMAIYYGLQLQLFAYLNVAAEEKIHEGYAHVVPAGVFYFQIDDPIIDQVKNREKINIDAQILKALRLRGIVLDEPDVIAKLDGSIQGASDVIPVTIKSDGTISKVSSVMNQEGFKQIQGFVAHKIKELGTEIVEGCVNPNPYKKGEETACDYCQYLSACQFENASLGNQYRTLNKLSDKSKLFQSN